MLNAEVLSKANSELVQENEKLKNEVNGAIEVATQQNLAIAKLTEENIEMSKWVTTEAQLRRDVDKMRALSNELSSENLRLRERVELLTKDLDLLRSGKNQVRRRRCRRRGTSD